ncbi:SYFM protein, partial [Pandion haliaetus]|nr:SYFM protein [Pandion haliaetus]
MAMIWKFMRVAKYSKTALSPKVKVRGIPTHSRHSSSKSVPSDFAANTPCSNTVELLGKAYPQDDYSNVTEKILSKVGKNLHNKKYHPLWLIKEQGRKRAKCLQVYLGSLGCLKIKVFLLPLEQESESYLICLIITDNCVAVLLFLCCSKTSVWFSLKCGDDFVFFRNTLIRLKKPPQIELFSNIKDGEGLQLFEQGHRTAHKQECHTMEAVRLVEFNLKQVLTKLMTHIFGDGLQVRWVDCYFPFTHPSFEMEINFQGEWMEVLGCGVMEQQLVNS